MLVNPGDPDKSGTVTSAAQCWQPRLAVPAVTESPRWYAIQTRARHEKIVAHQLQVRGITVFLPLVTEIHRWSDRRKVVQLPLFSGYVFVHLSWLPECRMRVPTVFSVSSACLEKVPPSRMVKSRAFGRFWRASVRMIPILFLRWVNAFGFEEGPSTASRGFWRRAMGTRRSSSRWNQFNALSQFKSMATR
jgi:Transcription termination factor nusG